MEPIANAVRAPHTHNTSSKILFAIFAVEFRAFRTTIVARLCFDVIF